MIGSTRRPRCLIRCKAGTVMPQTFTSSGIGACSYGINEPCGLLHFSRLSTSHFASSTSHYRSPKRTGTRLGHTYAAADENVDLISFPQDERNENLPATEKEGYRSFICEGGEFLVAEDSTGRLNLSETFVLNSLSGELERVEAHGEICPEPTLYNVAEWGSEWEGNVFDDIPGKRWIMKIYFVPVASTEPYELDLECVYVLDGTKKTLERLTVQRLAPPDTPEQDLRMRIRDDGVFLDVVYDLPGPEEIHRAMAAGVPAMSRLEKEAAGLKEQEDDDRSGMEGVKHEGSGDEGEINEEEEEEDIYDDDNLRDFMVEVDDEGMDDEFDEVGEGDFDMPASDY